MALLIAAMSSDRKSVATRPTRAELLAKLSTNKSLGVHTIRIARPLPASKVGRSALCRVSNGADMSVRPTNPVKPEHTMRHRVESMPGTRSTTRYNSKWRVMNFTLPQGFPVRRVEQVKQHPAPTPLHEAAALWDAQTLEPLTVPLSNADMDETLRATLRLLGQDNRAWNRLGSMCKSRNQAHNRNGAYPFTSDSLRDVEGFRVLSETLRRLESQPTDRQAELRADVRRVIAEDPTEAGTWARLLDLCVSLHK